MKKNLLGIFLVLLCLFFTGNVYAAETCSTDCAAEIGETKYDTLDKALQAVKDGETVKVLKNIVVGTTGEDGGVEGQANGQIGRLPSAGEAVTFTVDLNEKTLSSTNDLKSLFMVQDGSSVTIKNGTIDYHGDNSALEVTSGAVTLDGVTIKIKKAGSTIITVGDDTELTVNNSKLYYTTGSNDEKSTEGSTEGIHIGSNTVVNVNKTEIYATYAVWVNGDKNNVTINNESDIHGYAALDITNGSSNKASNTQATDNVVTVNNSTLTGHNPYSADETNGYGTVVIGGQKGLELTITESTITNTTTHNREDLILFSESYADSEGVEVDIIGSKLTNTDNANGSAVFNYSNTTLAAANTIASSGNTVTGTLYPASEETMVYVTIIYTFEDLEVEITKAYTSSEVTEKLQADLADVEAEYEVAGYEVEGYYTDADYENAVNFEQGIANDTTIYVKTSKVVIPDSGSTPAPDTDVDTDVETETPDTLDNVIGYVAAGLVSVLGLSGLGYSIKRKMQD